MDEGRKTFGRRAFWKWKQIVLPFYVCNGRKPSEKVKGDFIIFSKQWLQYVPRKISHPFRDGPDCRLNGFRIRVRNQFSWQTRDICKGKFKKYTIIISENYAFNLYMDCRKTQEQRLVWYIRFVTRIKNELYGGWGGILL